MTKKLVYKITFLNQGKIYEVYAKNVSQSGMFGFIEIEGLLFGEKTTVVIDPSEERLKNEFAGVERTYVPLHSVIRIDQVEKRGASKITQLSGKDDNIMQFPNVANMFAQSNKKENND